jgi:hypothetical protein
MSLLTTLAVSAAKRPILEMPDMLTKALKFLLVDLMHLSRSSAGIAYLKLIIWLLVTIFVYLALEKSGLFKERKGLAGFAASLFALIGVIFIPSRLIIGIFSINAAIVGIASGLAPVGVAFWLNYRFFSGGEFFHRVFRAFLYFVMAILTYAMIVVISEI